MSVKCFAFDNENKPSFFNVLYNNYVIDISGLRSNLIPSCFSLFTFLFQNVKWMSDQVTSVDMAGNLVQYLVWFNHFSTEGNTRDIRTIKMHSTPAKQSAHPNLDIVIRYILYRAWISHSMFPIQCLNDTASSVSWLISWREA